MTRTLETTGQFKKDAKREHRSDPSSATDLQAVISLLANDAAMAASHRDHKLSGEWKEHRECHVRPDLLLIYKKPKSILRLVRFGSHSELFDA